MRNERRGLLDRRGRRLRLLLDGDEVAPQRRPRPRSERRGRARRQMMTEDASAHAERSGFAARRRCGGWRAGSTLPGRAGRVSQTALSLVITFLGLLFVTFVIGRVIPIDPVLADRRRARDAGAGTKRRARRSASTSRSWCSSPSTSRDVLTGDFGKSLLTARPVIEDIARVFPATLELATIATLLGVLLGVPAGVAGRREPRPLARPADPLRRPDRLFDAGLLARPDRRSSSSTASSAGSAGPGRLDVSYEFSYELDVVAADRLDPDRLRRSPAPGTSSATRSATSCCRPACSATSRSPTSRA